MNEVQRRCRNEFGTPPPTCVTVALLCDKFGAGGTVQGTRNSENLTGQLKVEVLRQWQCSCETGVCITSVCHILQSEKLDRVKRSVEYSPWSPYFTSLDFYLQGILKITVCTRKPRILETWGTEFKLPLLLFHQQPWE
jgi:hypothetical protein